MTNPSQSDLRDMARELVRGSIIEDATAQFVALVLKHVHDERIAPLKARIAELEKHDTIAVCAAARVILAHPTALMALSYGYDGEDAARMGEPNPHTIIGEDAEYEAGWSRARANCARAGLERVLKEMGRDEK